MSGMGICTEAGGREHNALGHCKSCHIAATVLGWVARRDEFTKVGHERSLTVLKVLRSALKPCKAILVY